MALGNNYVEGLIQLFLEEWKSLALEKKQIAITWDESISKFLKNMGFSHDLGARPLRKIVEKTIITVIAKEICSSKIHSGDSIKISANNGEIIIDTLTEDELELEQEE